MENDYTIAIMFLTCILLVGISIFFMLTSREDRILMIKEGYHIAAIYPLSFIVVIIIGLVTQII